jgi:hypothetical protein
MDTKEGKVFSDLPIGESVDAVKFDNDQVFASTGDAQLAVATETSRDKFTIVQTVKTGDGARTMGLDMMTHRIYLPSADYAFGANGKLSPSRIRLRFSWSRTSPENTDEGPSSANLQHGVVL